jgi:hypothetical protein
MTVSGNPNPYNGSFCLVNTAACVFADKCTNLWTLKVAGGGTTLTSSNGAVYTLSETFNCNGLNSFALAMAPAGTVWQPSLTISPTNCNAYPCYPKCTQTSGCCGNVSVNPYYLVDFWLLACPHCNDGPLAGGTLSYQATLTFDPASNSYLSPTIPSLYGQFYAFGNGSFYIKAVCAVEYVNGKPQYYFSGEFYNGSNNTPWQGMGFTLPCSNQSTCFNLPGFTAGCDLNTSNGISRVNDPIYTLIHTPDIAVLPSGSFLTAGTATFTKPTTNPPPSPTIVPSCAPWCTPYTGVESCDASTWNGVALNYSCATDCSACGAGLAGLGVDFTFTCNWDDLPTSIKCLVSGYGVNGPLGPSSAQLGYLWFKGSLGGWATQIAGQVGGGMNMLVCDGAQNFVSGLTLIWHGPCDNEGGLAKSSTIYAVVQNVAGGADVYSSIVGQQFECYPETLAQLGINEGENPNDGYFAGCVLNPKTETLQMMITPSC